MTYQMYQMYQPFNPSIKIQILITGLKIYIFFFSQDLLGEFDDVYSIKSLMKLVHFSVTLGGRISKQLRLGDQHRYS